MQPARECIDLHCHSVYSSDAWGLPEGYVSHALRCRVRALAPTEHNNLDSLPAYLQAVRRQAVRLDLYAGCEITVASERWGRFDVLAYFFDDGHHELRGLLRRIQDAERWRMEEVIRRMNADGRCVDPMAAFAQYRKDVPYRAVGPEAVWTWLFKTGGAASLSDAKTIYAAYQRAVPLPPTADFEEAARIVHASRGIAVLAHPRRKFGEADVEELLRQGLDGVEVFSPNNEAIEDWRERCLRRGWPMSGGSDYHGSTDDFFSAWPTIAPAGLLEGLFHANERRHGRTPQPLN